MFGHRSHVYYISHIHIYFPVNKFKPTNLKPEVYVLVIAVFNSGVYLIHSRKEPLHTENKVSSNYLKTRAYVVI